MSKEQDKQAKPYRKMSKAELINDIELKVSKILGLQHQIEELKGKNNIPLRMEFKFATNRYSNEYLRSLIERTTLLFKIKQFENFANDYNMITFEYRQFKDGNYVVFYHKEMMKRLIHRPLFDYGLMNNNNLSDISNNNASNVIKELRFYDNLDLVNKDKESKDALL